VTVFNLGIDMDGVIAKLDDEMIFRMNRDGYDPKYEEWTTFSIEENCPHIPNQWIVDQFADRLFWLNMKAYEDAWYTINKWFFANNNIFFITSRPKDMDDITGRWLEEWRINYNLVSSGYPRGEKYKAIERFDLDLFIEDRPIEAKEISNHIPTFLLDRSYNRSADIGTAMRVKDFYEIEGEISQWAKQSSALDAEISFL
jgi:uncharacterized HAD superfamily protein